MVEPPSKEYLLPIVICQKSTPCLLPSLNSITNCMHTINFWQICNKSTIYHDQKALQTQKSNTVLANLQAQSEYYKKGHFSCANPLLSTVVSENTTWQRICSAGEWCSPLLGSRTLYRKESNVGYWTNVHLWKGFQKQPILQYKCLDHAESLLFDAGGLPRPGQHQGARVVHH